MEKSTNSFVIRLNKNKENIRLVAVFAFVVVVCMPFSTINMGGIGILMLMGVPLFLLCMPIMLNCIRKKLWNKDVVFLLFFFVYGILGYIWTPLFSTYSLYTYLKNFIIVVCLFCQPFNNREKDVLLGGSIVSCLIVCWFMLTGNSNIGYLEGRASIAVFGQMQDPNYIGFVFIAPMAVATYQFINNRVLLVKIISALFAVVILYCVMLTGSRGALVGVAVVVVITVINKFRELWVKIVFCTVMGCVILIVFDNVLSLLPSQIAMRFSLQNILETRGTKRGDIWIHAFQVMKDSPHKLLFGFGTGSSVAVVGRATHNYFIQLLLELGIVGTSLFVGFFRIWFKRLRDQDTLCLSIIMGCMGLAMTLSVNTNYYFWITMTLGVVCSKRRHR